MKGTSQHARLSGPLLIGLEDNRPSPVAEENAAVSVVPVHPSAQSVRPYDDGVLNSSVVQELPRRDSTEEEATARGRQIVGEGILATQGRGHAGSVTEHVLGGRRGADDQADVQGVDPGHLDSIGRCTHAKGADVLLLVLGAVGVLQQVAARYTRSGADPLVGGLYDGLEVDVGDDGLWRRAADADRSAIHGASGDHGQGHAHSPPGLTLRDSIGHEGHLARSYGTEGIGGA